MRSPGQDKRHRPKKGEYGPNRRMWGEFGPFRFALYISEVTVKTEPGDDISIFFYASGKSFQINLSSLTEEELLAFERMVNISIEAARETCARRDVHAEEALADGRTFARLFRNTPKIFRRRDDKPDLPASWEANTEESEYLDQIFEAGTRQANAQKEEADRSGTFGSYAEEGVSEYGGDLDQCRANE